MLKLAAHLDGEAEQAAGRVEAFGAGVDLDGLVELRGGGEDELGVEGRLRAAAADDDAAGAVAEDVHVRIGERGDHAAGHLLAVHAQLGVHAGDDDVELREEIGLLVEGAVLEDVDLDAGEDAEGRQLFVEGGDDLELLAQALGG